MQKETLTEFNKWYYKEMAHVGIKFLAYCHAYLRFPDDSNERDRILVFARENFLPAIITNRLRPVVLMSRGFDIEFNWPPPKEDITDDGVPILQEAEPRFTFYDRSLGELLPSERTDLFDTLEGIGEEIQDVYKLDFHRFPRLELVYPKHDYAEPLGIRKALLLG